MEIFGYSALGYEGELVRIEVDLRRGIPGMEIVGLAGGAVREARERIRIALRQAGFQFPADRILVNLSPADLPKSGSGFDLPMALAILHASGQFLPPFKSLLAVGELSLSARVRAVPGVLSAVARGSELGVEAFVVPEDCLAEARCLRNVQVFPADSLDSLIRGVSFPEEPSFPEEVNSRVGRQPGFFQLRGHPHAARALELSAAGGHSVLFYGPPGSGKTLAAKSLEELMPELSDSSALETTRVWSLAGKLSRGSGLLRNPPFRVPHHSSSVEGLLGGGRDLKPGEVSLAHNGVLFLDEAPEFAPRVLQSLREPLEAGSIQVVRAGRSVKFPSRFQLVLTANSCPCGQLGRERGVCLCGAQEVRRYWDRLGNALLDRIDLRIFMAPAPPESVLRDQEEGVDSRRARVEAALAVQRIRDQPAGVSNAALDAKHLALFCSLPPVLEKKLVRKCEDEDWSSRGLHSLLKIARTCADLGGRNDLEERDLEEAFSFKKPRGEEYWQN